MKVPAKPILIGGGVLLLAAVAVWLTRKGNAASIGSAAGGAAVDLVAGVIGGVAGGIVDAANDPSVNPLQPFGAWLGGTFYDITH